MMNVERMPLGMFDQEGLYPHLLSKFHGDRIAVPLAEIGEGLDEGYQVPSFAFQPLQLSAFGQGWWFPILRVKLSGAVQKHQRAGIGMMRVVSGGLLELGCITPSGSLAWVPLPACLTDKPAGTTYRTWQIFVRTEDGPHLMVRYDGASFEHWPETRGP